MKRQISKALLGQGLPNRNFTLYSIIQLKFGIKCLLYDTFASGEKILMEVLAKLLVEGTVLLHFVHLLLHIVLANRSVRCYFYSRTPNISLSRIFKLQDEVVGNSQFHRKFEC